MESKHAITISLTLIDYSPRSKSALLCHATLEERPRLSQELRTSTVHIAQMFQKNVVAVFLRRPIPSASELVEVVAGINRVIHPLQDLRRGRPADWGFTNFFGASGDD